MMSRFETILMMSVSFVLMVCFQSCSNNYKIDTAGGAPLTTASTPVDPGNPTVPTPPADIPDFACEQIQILPLSNPMVIPARDATTGMCYAVQIFSAIANGSSSLTTTIDDGVISRNHDGGNSDPNKTHHPYLMGQETLTVSFQGLRNITLSGSATDASAPILIDNFALVGFKAFNGSVGTAADLSPSDYGAFGTLDSTVGTTNGILMNNQVVPLTGFGPNGTATVTALDISQAIQIDQSYLLDVRAEDCGGLRQLSNVFVIFK